MRVISLFSGIGGLDLGFERAGFEIVAQVESDNFCRKVLRKHWPKVALYEDVRNVGKHNLPDADVIMGGFPCQDISLAGKRQGIKEGTRSGLWLEFARVIGELRPRIVLLENVPAITTLDGTRVIADLAALGYDAEWGIVAASDAGAPHRRERWFCVAYPGLSGRDTGKRLGSSAAPMGEMADGRFALGSANVAVSRRIRRRQRGNYRGWGLVSHHQHRNAAQSEPEGSRRQCRFGAPSQIGDMGNAVGTGLAQREGIGGNDGKECAPAERTGRDVAVGTHGAIEPLFCRVADGLSAELDRSGVIEYAASKKIRSRQILRSVRKVACQAAIQWTPRRLGTIPQSAILRSPMSGGVSTERTAHSCGALLPGAALSRRPMRLLRKHKNAQYSSYRWKPIKQRTLEPHDLVQCLSYPMALDAWKRTIQKAVGLQNLRRAIKSIRPLPKTLSALQKTWRSMPDYEKEWCAIRACQGDRLLWPARPGEAQAEWEAPRTVTGKMKDRASRIKALGNAVVPQVAYAMALVVRAFLEKVEAS